MKRYETMSKEEIMDFYINCQNRDCKDCVKEQRTSHAITKCATDYLNEEVPEPLMVRRYQNICCKQDMTEMLEVIRARCVEQTCNGCAFGSMSHCATNRFIDYLCELEPEREKEWYLDEKYNKSRKQKA